MGLGEVNSQKFIDRIDYIKNTSMYDYELLGALGFDNMAKAKWKLILNKYTLGELMNMDNVTRYSAIAEIKGLGPETARTFVDRYEFFVNDLVTILQLPNIKSSKGITLPKVRITGFRNQDLIDEYSKKGFDIGEGSVTKHTNILLVKSLSHDSPKVTKAKEYGILIMTEQQFREQY